MAINYTTLRTELNTDPRGYGYAALIQAGADNALADALNLSRPAIQLDTNKIKSDDFVGQIVYTEFIALTQAQRDYMAIVLSPAVIDLSNTNIRNGLGTIFGANTTTRANVLAAQKRAGSRSEELFGLGTVVTDADVAHALRG